MPNFDLPDPIDADVDYERDLRLFVGTDVTITTGSYTGPNGDGSVAISASTDMQTAVTALRDYAIYQRDVLLDTTTTSRFRDEDDNNHDLTPDQIDELWRLGFAFSQLIYNSSWDLKDTSPIPKDFKDDTNWT